MAICGYCKTPIEGQSAMLDGISYCDPEERGGFGYTCYEAAVDWELQREQDKP